MNLSDINPNLPCLRPLTSSQTQKRRMSSSTNSKSTHSSSSTQSKTVNSLPVLIQLCIYPNEEYAYETMKILFSSRYNYSPNVCDEFGCNVLMYTLRYQRFQLFNFLLNEISLDLNLRSKDRQGNTILHYAIMYGSDDTEILDKLIEKFNEFSINIDERNYFGFTPLLLAMLCGRYDLVLSLLMKTDASPFVQDYIQSKNLIDYLEIDTNHREHIRKLKKTGRSTPGLTRESTRLHIQLYQSLPPRSERSQHIIHHHHRHKNFFENVLPQIAQDRSGSMRSLILKMFNNEYLSIDLTRLIHYINERYPNINTPKKQENFCDKTTTTKLVFQRENSKTNVHQIINLFDPNLRPKATLPKAFTTQTYQLTTSNVKAPMTFKRIGAKLTVLTAISRPQATNKRNKPTPSTNSTNNIETISPTDTNRFHDGQQEIHQQRPSVDDTSHLEVISHVTDEDK